MPVPPAIDAMSDAPVEAEVGPPTTCSRTVDSASPLLSTPTVTSSIQVTPIRVTPTTAPPTTASCGTAAPRRTGTPSSLRTTPATHRAVRPPALTTAAMRVPSRESAMPAIAVAPLHASATSTTSPSGR